MRLIDADALLERMKRTNRYFNVKFDIDEAPTVDAAPVVRCGECERRNKSADLTDSVYCRWLKLQMRKKDFCSYGERREGDAAPVVHARWEINPDGYYPYCSNCKAEPKSGKMTPTCPNCGARMDLEVDGDEP